MCIYIYIYIYAYTHMLYGPRLARPRRTPTKPLCLTCEPASESRPTSPAVHVLILQPKPQTLGPKP